MDAFLQFFEQMPAWQKLLWVALCLGVGWALEGLAPLVRRPYRKWRHAGVNGVFLATNLAVNVLFAAATVGLVGWMARAEVGLLHLVAWPVWAELLATLLVLDLVAQYVAHVLLHRVRWMWRLHVVHHSDTKVDATTGVRHHPGDYAVRESFALLGLALTGAPFAFYLVYRIVTIFFTVLVHANVAVPRWLDAPLSRIFVTPNMHKFHHHFEQPWTDTNFGGIFSIWDRLFGTFVYGDPRRVRYGLDVLSRGGGAPDDVADEDVVYQLKLPFRGRLDRGE